MNPDKGPFLELVHEARINDLVKGTDDEHF